MNLTLEQFGIGRLDLQQRWELIGLIGESLPDDAPFTPPRLTSARVGTTPRCGRRGSRRG